MGNPWKDISLSDYENHMCLDSVKQLQALNEAMKEQFDMFPVDNAMVLGVAGGNGLEHIDPAKFVKVYGVDINAGYLEETKNRYKVLSGILECLCLDLVNESDKLPNSDLLIANLLIEYIGYEAFQKAVKKIDPKYVSAVIQINTDTKNWVSDSPYLHAFDRLDEVHHQMEENALTDAMSAVGYSFISKDAKELPNGKALVRLDYKKA